MPERSRTGAKEESSSVHRLSATIGVSVLAHTAAIGVLLIRNPVPYPAPPLDTIEISIEPEQPPTSRYAFAGTAAESSAHGSEALLQSSMYPKGAAAGLTPDWLRVDHSFDMPAPSTFRPHPHGLAIDTLATMLDCLTPGRSRRGESKRSLPAHPPCPSEYPFLRAPVMRDLSMDVSQPNVKNSDSDYRTFKTIQPLFDESLLHQEVPQANRAFKNWIGRLLP
jgi:hypothetical protein